jgi:phosphatidylglycerol:prolipoprotein diacylglycerol transferase
MCLLAYALWKLRDRVRPGVVLGLYLVLSGLERLLVEFIRRNKEVLWGLTAPQLESIALMIAGAVLLTVLQRRGGLGVGRSSGILPAWQPGQRYRKSSRSAAA